MSIIITKKNGFIPISLLKNSFYSVIIALIIKSKGEKMVRGRSGLTPQEEQLKKVIASNIKKYLLSNNKKAVELQRGTGISQSSVSEYINAKTLPSAGNTQKIADFFGILKSDIDPRYKDGYSIEEWKESQIDTPIENNPIIDETVETMKHLDEARQQVVLATANVQLKEQNDSKAKVIPIKKKSNVLTDEALQEAVDTAVAFDGIPLNEQEKEAAKALIRRFWEEDHPED